MQQLRKLRNEFIAERAFVSGVNEEPGVRHPANQLSRLAAAAGAAAGAIAAGRSPVAMYLSVRGGTSPTAVTWCPSTIVVNAEATPDRVVPWVGFFAAGEIARHQLYGYTGVLTVVTGKD